MTSKLKCPFCQQGLIREYKRNRDTIIYHCNNCYFQGDGIIWIALIQAKQDLEIARKTLKQIVCADKDGKPLKGVLSCWLDMDELNKCIEQIEHKEEK